MSEVRTLVEKTDRDFYDTYQVTDEGALTDHRVFIASAMNFFCGIGLSDQRITNMRMSSVLPGEQSFLISHFGLHVQFSDPKLYQLFFRDCRFMTYIGHKPYIELTASHFADPGCWIEDAPDDPEADWAVPRMSYQGGFTGFWPLRHEVSIPPRDVFEVRLDNGPDFAAAVREVESEPPDGFVLHIRPILRGVLTRSLM